MVSNSASPYGANFKLQVTLTCLRGVPWNEPWALILRVICNFRVSFTVLTAYMFVKMTMTMVSDDAWLFGMQSLGTSRKLNAYGPVVSDILGRTEFLIDFKFAFNMFRKIEAK